MDRLRKHLEGVGLDGERTIQDWRDSWESDSIIDNFIKTASMNLRALRNLEEMEPGAAGALQKTFNISNFARWCFRGDKQEFDPSLLVDQYKSIDDRESEFVYFVAAKSDGNGAFYARRNKWAKLAKDLWDAGFEMRIVEAGNCEELEQLHTSCHKRYGLAAGRVLAGHGRNWPVPFFTLGNHKAPYNANKNVIIYSGNESETSLQKTRQCLRDGAPELMISCHRGGEVAQRASEDSNAVVTTVDGATSLEQITVSNEGGMLSFDLESDAGVAVYEAGFLTKRKDRIGAKLETNLSL